jgi:hypothetical protein
MVLSEVSQTAPQMTIIARHEAIQSALMNCFTFGSQ